MNFFDELKRVGLRALRDGADAVAVKKGETPTIVEAVARSSVSVLAKACADEIETTHCAARTRVTMGQSGLRCGKAATKVLDMVYYCNECAPARAIPIDLVEGE